MHNFYNSTEEKDIIYHKGIKKVGKFLKNNFYLILLMLGVLSIVFCSAMVWDGSYADGDGYMRLIRIKQWLLEPTFYEQKIMVSNYPFGEILHWTKGVDFLWMIVSLLFSFVGRLDDVLFLGGAFLSPIMGVLAGVVVGYGLKRNFNVWLSLLGVIFFFNHHVVQAEFSFYKADHHSVMIVLFGACFSLLLCWLKKKNDRYLVEMALCLALASHVMIDGVIFAILLGGFLIYLYVFCRVSVVYAYKLMKFYFLFILVLWALNPPYEGFFTIDNGQLSFLFVVAFLMLCIGLKVLSMFSIHTIKLKLVSVLCVGGIIFCLLVVLFGKDIFAIPVSFEVYEIWAKQISETKPIWDVDLQRMFSIYFTEVVAIGVGVWLMIKKENKRLIRANLFVGGGVFWASIFSLRFSRYFPIFEIVPYLVLIDGMFKKSSFYLSKKGEFPGSVYMAILVVLFIPPLSLLPQSFDNDRLNTQKKEYYNPLVVNKIREIGGTIVTDTFLAPRYVWEAKVNTVSTPYHKNVEGIVDGVSILFSENDEELLKLLLKHQVSMVLVFDEYGDKFYDMDEKNKNKLYWRLIKKERVPYFLEEVNAYFSYVKLYRVVL